MSQVKILKNIKHYFKNYVTFSNGDKGVSLCADSKEGGGGEIALLDFSWFEALALVLLFFRIAMKVNMLKNKCRK